MIPTLVLGLISGLISGLVGGLALLQSPRMAAPNTVRTSTDTNILNAPGITEHFKDGVTILGKLVFPSDVRPTVMDIELEDVSGTVVRSAKSGPRSEFRFDGVLLPNFNETYYVVVQGEGFDNVRQQLILSSNNFTGATVTIQLKHAPGSLSADLEDVVSIASLGSTPSREAQKLYDRAREEQRKNDFRKALADLQKAVELAPDYYEANLQLGLEYQSQEHPQEAIRPLAHAIEVNPGSMKARAALGQIYCDMGRFEEAATLLAEAARLGNTSSSVYYAMGISYQKLDDPDRAEDSLLRALVISGGNLPQAYLALHNIYLKRKQLDKALGQLDAYLKKYPAAEDHVRVQAAADKLRKVVFPH